MSATSFRAGLVGAGYVSEYHIQALRRLKQVSITGICDLDPQRLKATAETWGLRAFPSLKALLEAGVDVIHVLTPPRAHTAVALEALAAGCHLLIEKPLAPSVEECDRIAEAARQAGKTVGVNHSLLRDPFVLKALAIARSGAIGGVITCDYFRSSDTPPWLGGPLPPHYRDGGHPWRDLGVHALYLLAEVLGPIADAQWHFWNKGGDPNLLFDEWRALVRCARGSGQVQISWNVRPLQSLLVIQGTRGVVRADLFSLSVTTRRSLPGPKAAERVLNPLREALALATQTPANVLRFLRKKILPFHGLQALVADYYRALAEGAPPPVTIAQARPIVEWTERIANEADQAKTRYLAGFPKALTATTLVTGATGFLGRRLVAKLLEGGERLRLFVRREPATPIRNHPNVEVVLGDLGDPEAMERAVAGVKLIFHVGAAMSGAPWDFERSTAVGTRNLIASALRHGSPKIVYVSSLSVLHAAAARPGLTVTEDWPYEPWPERRGAYTQSKLDAERAILRAVEENQLPVVILRPGRIFGPGTEPITPEVARRAGSRLIILGNGRWPLPLVYVDDVVDALLAAAQGPFDGSIFQLVDPQRITQEEYAREYIRARAPHLKVTKVPRLVVDTLALGVEILAAVLRRPAPLSRYRVASALAPMVFDCSRAERGLGWKPRVGVREGLSRLLAAGRS